MGATDTTFCPVGNSRPEIKTYALISGWSNIFNFHKPASMKLLFQIIL